MYTESISSLVTQYTAQNDKKKRSFVLG